VGGQLDELLASLAARCRVCLPFLLSVFSSCIACMVTNKYDNDDPLPEPWRRRALRAAVRHE